MSKRVIEFHYKLSNVKGEELDTSAGREPLAFLEGSGQIIPALEECLVKLQKGEKKRVQIAAADGYGERDESKVAKVPLQKLKGNQEVRVGDRFRGDDDPHSPIFEIAHLTDVEATLDANHPLAGQDLVFDVEIVGSREATQDEITHGHAHGEHGHHH